MERLTHERVNGILEGYWSQAKKDELIQRLGAYEDTGLEPEEIMQIKKTLQNIERKAREKMRRMSNDDTSAQD